VDLSEISQERSERTQKIFFPFFSLPAIIIFNLYKDPKTESPMDV
jgi:hypothetical protein